MFNRGNLDCFFKRVSRARNLINSSPKNPSRSDDLCLFFCLYPSSMGKRTCCIKKAFKLFGTKYRLHQTGNFLHTFITIVYFYLQTTKFFNKKMRFGILAKTKSNYVTLISYYPQTSWVLTLFHYSVTQKFGKIFRTKTLNLLGKYLLLTLI